MIGPSTSRLGDPPDRSEGSSAAHQTRRDVVTNHHVEAGRTHDDETAERHIAVGLVNDDHQALDDAFRRWGEMIHALCTRWAGVDAADDLTQQVFVAAWQSRGGYDPDRAPLGAWLVGIARNLANRSFRGIREVPMDPSGSTDEPFERDRSDHVADELVVAQALANLPDAQRRTLELSYWEGLTQAEVASTLDMPLGTVKSHQRRGLRQLRGVLEVSHVDR